jgi:ketosteroid isomerase-like protein
MNRTGRLAAAALALLLATGAAKPAPPPTPESQLLASDRAFSKLSIRRGQPYAFLATMANDGRLYGNGNDAPVYGKAQAFRRMARRLPGTLSWEPETARVSSDGRMGWTSGHWLFVARGARQKTTGNYLTVWVKDRRGAWKVQAEMGTSDLAGKK